MLSSLLMNDTMTVFSYIQQFQPRAVMNFSRSSMVKKNQFSNNLIQLDIAYPRMPEWVKGFADFLSHRIPGLRSTCRKAKLFIRQVNPFWDSTGKCYIYNLVTKEKFCDKPNLSTLSKTLEAMKIHATMNGISTIAIPKLGCGLDQMNWQEVVKLLRDIFAYADVKLVVYTLEENGVHALSAEGDAEFYADDEIERCSEEFLLENRQLETDFTKDSKYCHPACDEQFPVLREKDHNDRLIDHYLQYQPKEITNYVKEFDCRYSGITDEEMILMIDMLVDARDVYSQHKFDVGKTRQKLHVTLKPNVELKRQRPIEVPLHLKEKLEKLLTQLKDADIFREMGDDVEMGSLFVNPIILMPKNDYVKLMIDARYLNSVADLTNYSWPLEPVQMIMTRVNGKVFSVSDLSCAYHQVPLSPETQKLTSFIIGGKQYTYTRGFYGLCGLRNFFSRLMTIHFDPLIKKKQAITYIDDTIMQSQNKNEMFTVINQYHTLLRKAGLKAAPDKTFFFLKKVKLLGQFISPEGIQPIAKRVKDLKNLNHLKVNETSWKFLGPLDSTVVIFRTSMWIASPSMTWLRTRLPFNGHMNTKSYSNQLKIGLVKTLSSPCPLLTILFILMWTQRTLGLVVFWSNSSLRQNASFPSTLEFSIKPNRKRLLYIENFVE